MIASAASPSSPADSLARARALRSAAAEEAAGARSALEVAEAELSRRQAEAREVRFALKTEAKGAKAGELRQIETRISELKAQIAELEPDVTEAGRVDAFFAEKESDAYETWCEVEADRIRAAAAPLYADAVAAASEARDALGRLMALNASSPRGDLGLVPARSLILCNLLDDWVTTEVEREFASRAPTLRYDIRPEPRAWPGTYVVRRKS